MSGLRLWAWAVATAMAGAAHAHPHVFVEAAVEVIFDDQGRATSLRVDWTYDELYSMLLIAERQLDPDQDGGLTTDELAQLQGFDLNWDPAFAGDTYALAGDRPLDLSRPRDGALHHDGLRLTSSHTRDIVPPLAPGPGGLVVQVYDPGFYSAYTIVSPARLTGAPPDCRAQVWEPDRAAADAILAAAMEEYSGADAEFPAVGAAYAEEVRVTCSAP